MELSALVVVIVGTLMFIGFVVAMNLHARHKATVESGESEQPKDEIQG